MPLKKTTPIASPAKGVVDSMTAREKEIMAFAWECFETEPSINLDKLCTMAGFTNKGSASNAVRNIRTKLGLTKSKSDANGSATTTPTKGKKHASSSDDEEEATPKKKQARRAAKVKAETKLEEEDEDEVAKSEEADDGAEEE